MTVPATTGTTAEPTEPDAFERLALALIVSVTLHGIVVAWPTRPAAGTAEAKTPPAPLLAELARVETSRAEPLPLPLAEPVRNAPVAVGPKVGADATPASRQARFANPPDFSAAAAVDLSGPAHLKLRIHVTSTGAVNAIEVLESHQVPAEFLAAVHEGLERASYLPDESTGRPAAGSFAIVIEAQSPDRGSSGLAIKPDR